MKKILSFFLFVLMMSISVQAQEFIPILEDFEYSDELSRIAQGDDVTPTYGCMWLIQITDGGNAVEVTVFDSDGDAIIDLPLYNVTASAIFGEDENIMGFIITDDDSDDDPILAILLDDDGNWVLVTDEVD